MKVVLDTNVFVSGIFWKGDSNMTLAAWKEMKFTLVISAELISEITKVLNDFKIKLPKNMIEEAVGLIIRNSILVEPKEKINVVKDDTKDNMFIEAAVSGDVSYIVSQDKHLLRLKEFRGIKIICPVEFNKIFYM